MPLLIVVPTVPSASSSEDSKVPSRVHFPWDLGAEKLLIHCYVKLSAYKETKASNIKQKGTHERNC